MWFVHFFVERYEDCDLREFHSEQDVIAFLDSHGGNSEFRFRVIQGTEITFLPLNVATKYQRA